MKDRNFSLLNHILCAVLAKDGISPEYLGALALPDAVHARTGMWQYSHFAFGYGFTFPAKMYGITKEIMEEQMRSTGKEGILLPEIKVGGEISLERYGRLNKKHLPHEMYCGIKDHLRIDSLFDAFLQSKIDCSKEEEGEYVFRGQAFTPEGISKVILKINDHVTYILAQKLYHEKGITADNAWIKVHVIPMLEDAYGRDLVKYLVPELTMETGMNRKIRKHEPIRPMACKEGKAIKNIMKVMKETDRQLGK